MKSTTPNSGVVKFTKSHLFEEGNDYHDWREEKTVNLNTNEVDYIKEEKFGGRIAKARGSEGILLEENNPVRFTSEETQDEAYKLLSELSENFDNLEKEALPFYTRKQYKTFESKMKALIDMHNMTDMYGNIDGWDVFILPKYNMVFEIYYVWSGKKRIRKLTKCELS